MEDVLAGPARIAIGIVLCAAGTAKLRTGHDRFLRAVLGYDLIKGRSAAFFARALPWVEIALGGALAVGIAPGPVVAVIASGFLLWISAGAAALLGAFAGTITVCAMALGWFRACQNCWEACRMENQRIWNQWLQQQQLQRGAA